MNDQVRELRCALADARTEARESNARVGVLEAALESERAAHADTKTELAGERDWYAACCKAERELSAAKALIDAFEHVLVLTMSTVQFGWAGTRVGDCTAAKAATFARSIRQQAEQTVRSSPPASAGQEERLEVVATVTAPTKPRECNRHTDCDAADVKAREAGRSFADHCHDDCCEDCFGN